MGSKLILLDMDEVVVDLMPTVIQYYNAMYSSDITLEDITEWNLPEDMKAIFRIPDFFKNLPAVRNARRGMAQLIRNGYELRIVTDCMDNMSIQEQKLYWLRKLKEQDGLDIKATFTSDKSTVQGNVLVDDAIHHLKNFKKTNINGLPICMEKPWNKGKYFGLVVKDWDDLLARIKQL